MTWCNPYVYPYPWWTKCNENGEPLLAQMHAISSQRIKRKSLTNYRWNNITNEIIDMSFLIVVVWNTLVYLRLLNTSQTNMVNSLHFAVKENRRGKKNRFGLKIARTQPNIQFCQWDGDRMDFSFSWILPSPTHYPAPSIGQTRGLLSNIWSHQATYIWYMVTCQPPDNIQHRAIKEHGLTKQHGLAN